MQHTSGFIALCEKHRKNIPEISARELKQAIDNEEDFYLIDVRDPDEFAQGAIPTAIHLSKGWIEAKIEKVILDKNDKVVLYCGGGNRSILAAANLQEMGYKNVSSLANGYRGWCIENP
jgi:rhodanese-related sulfurtransferase